MNVVINSKGRITRIISHSSVPQEIGEDEVEIIVTDEEIIEAFYKGYEILYDKMTEEFYYEPRIETDPEKAILYEAVANLFEEVEALKKQLRGED